MGEDVDLYIRVAQLFVVNDSICIYINRLQFNLKKKNLFYYRLIQYESI